MNVVIWQKKYTHSADNQADKQMKMKKRCEWKNKEKRSECIKVTSYQNDLKEKKEVFRFFFHEIWPNV